MKLLTAAIALFIGSTPAIAAKNDMTPMLVNGCKMLMNEKLAVNNTRPAGYCQGYVDAWRSNFALDTMAFGGKIYRVCMPAPADHPSLQEMVQMFLDHVEENPELMQQRRFMSVVSAFRNKWPCEEG